MNLAGSAGIHSGLTAKNYVVSIVSLALGFLLAWLGGFQVLGLLGVDVPSVISFPEYYAA